MTEQNHILVVDDDPRIRSMLRRYLVDEGFRVSDASDGASMRAIMAEDMPHLVLLDVMIPGDDGFALARYIRQQAATPIIMLTGKSDLIDRVAGLEAGADDYIAKPFHLREVLARIRTVLRRTAPVAVQAQSPAKVAAPEEMFAFSCWQLDLLKRELRGEDGALVPLTTGEFSLLRVFVLNANRVLNRDQLMDLVKGREWTAYDRTIDTQIVRIRKKIERDPNRPALIKTVRGAGYVLATTVIAGKSEKL